MQEIDKMYWMIIVYIVMINLIGFLSMGIDKRRAIKKKYRISERCLFSIAMIGGSLGSILGMKKFHHKTKHWYFKYGMPSIFVLQILVIWYFIK